MNLPKNTVYSILFAVLAITCIETPPDPFLEPPTDLRYPESYQVIYKDSVMDTLDPAFSGWADNFSALPVLPDSLHIDPVTGEISGKPQKLQAQTTYLITATNSQTGASTTTLCTLSVIKYPSISVNPADARVTVGGKAVFSIEIDGTGPFKYQWYHGSLLIPNATAQTYIIDPVAQADVGNYTCHVEDNYTAKLTSEVARCIVTQATSPWIDLGPQNQTDTIGAKVKFTVIASGTNLSYAWYKNGLVIASENKPFYSIDSLTNAHAGMYKVVVGNTLGTVSDSARLIVQKPFYDIAVSTLGSGQIKRENALVTNGIQTVANGNSMRLDFLPSAGWSISRVMVDGVENPTARTAGYYSFTTVRSDQSIEVTFSRNRFMVTAVSNDTLLGNIIKKPADDSFSFHDTLTFIASPKPGSYFAGWSGTLGDADKVKDTLRLFVDSTLSLTASFAQIGKFPLSSSVSPVNSGTITKNPDATQYLKGTSVSITAHSATGYQFVGWTGNSTSSDTTITMVMDTTRSVTALFKAIVCTLSVAASPASAGSVTPVRDTSMGYFDSVAISATANQTSGYAFSVWRKISGTGTVIFGDSTRAATTVKVKNGSARIAAVFIQPAIYSIIGSVTPFGSGRVVFSPQKNLYAFGDTVRVTAQSELGYAFLRWTGDTTGIGATLTIVVKKNLSIVANFAASVSPDSIAGIPGSGQSFNGLIRQAVDLPGAGAIIYPAPGLYSDFVEVVGKTTVYVQRR